MPQATQPITSTIEPSGAGDSISANPPDLGAQLAQARASLAESERILSRIRRERDLTRALVDAGAIDMESAAALLQPAVESAEADLAGAVRQLRARKPALFRPVPDRTPMPPPRNQAAPTSMGAAPPGDQSPALTRAAQRAASGDRGALFTYMRLRRAVA